MSHLINNSSHLGALFKIGDKNGDGSLDKAEIKLLLEMSGFNFDLSSADEVCW